MPGEREGAAASGVEGRLYVCGGSDGSQSLSSVVCFDPLKSAWHEAPPMRQRRHRAVAATVAGVLCVMGGKDGEEHHQSMECLDLSSASHASWAPPGARSEWLALGSMSERRHGAVAAAIAGSVYVGGGFNGQFDLKSAERFATSTRTWESLPDMADRRHGPLAAAIGSNWYVCGGFDGPRLGGSEFLDTTTRTWHDFPSLPQWRRGAVAAAVAGKLYVCGGQGGFWSDAHLSSVEIFDPQSGLWQSFAVSLAEVSGDEAGAPAGAAPLADERRNAAAATVAV
mmetsp:Transcript_152021/g.488104  ORF Transcript_152021/g.488104 Transcript_152021/m.488104 type:complete len:283 (-) Transcript_152021:68-916(-)